MRDDRLSVGSSFQRGRASVSRYTRAVAMKLEIASVYAEWYRSHFSWHLEIGFAGIISYCHAACVHTAVSLRSLLILHDFYSPFHSLHMIEVVLDGGSFSVTGSFEYIFSFAVLIVTEKVSFRKFRGIRDANWSTL